MPSLSASHLSCNCHCTIHSRNVLTNLPFRAPPCPPPPPPTEALWLNLRLSTDMVVVLFLSSLPPSNPGSTPLDAFFSIALSMFSIDTRRTSNEKMKRMSEQDQVSRPALMPQKEFYRSGWLLQRRWRGRSFVRGKGRRSHGHCSNLYQPLNSPHPNCLVGFNEPHRECLRLTGSIVEQTPQTSKRTRAMRASNI